MKALVFEGKVVQIEAEEFPVAPALNWVDISTVISKPEVGWLYDGTVFSPPPPPPPAPKPVDVLSELVDALITKTALTMIDFSADAQAKITERKARRQ